MGREFELKYRCTEESFAALLGDYMGFSTIAMETTYYDTFDGRLSTHHWTLRRRLENGKSICTLKTPCPDGGRGEWEVESGSIMAAIPMLCKLGAPMDLMVFSISGVGAVCGAKFTRKALLVELTDCTVELALDEGKLLGNGRELPFREVEVELKEGSEDIAVAFARSLAEKYGLTSEPRSKYRRALELARGAE